MGNYFRDEPARAYSYKGLLPYGAGDIFSIDARLDSNFSGNAIEQLVSEGFYFAGKTLLSPDGKRIAVFVDEKERG